jgi:hypothetical protein
MVALRKRRAYFASSPETEGVDAAAEQAPGADKTGGAG